ncbi:MAG: hypothetical protein AB7O24_10135 [Kofleriaceae bacterium]
MDTRAFEYLDLIEMIDGTIWAGVVTEQIPLEQYKVVLTDGSLRVVNAPDVVKIVKQRNHDYRAPVAAGCPPPLGLPGDGVAVSGVSQPRRGGFAHPGVRLDPQLAVLFPTGTLYDAEVEPSFAPNLRIGYELKFGNLGITAGGMARFTYWRLGRDNKDAFWTLETHAIGRATMHFGRVAPYAGVSLGVDTNYTYIEAGELRESAVGIGINLETGLAIAVNPGVAFDLGVDLHPPTDNIVDGSDERVSYVAVRLGASVRL